MISIKTPVEIQLDLAQELKSKRKWLGHSRAEASSLTGVPEPTLRKFENTGEISLRQFLMLIHVYGDLSIFENVFPPNSCQKHG